MTRLLVVALVVALGSCERGSKGADTASSSSQWTIDPTPIVSIGNVGGDPSYIFAGVDAVRLMADGQVLVVDRSSGTLRLYDRAGRFEHQMGRRGRGPGEFEYLTDAWLAGPDTIVAYDAQSARLTEFLTDGSLVGTVTFHAPDGRPEIYLGSFGDGFHAVAWISQGPRDWSKISADVMEVGRFGPHGARAGTVAGGLGMRRLRSPLPFSPSFMAVMLGDTIFQTDGLDGRVEATDETGKAVRAFAVGGRTWQLQTAFQRLRAALDSAGAARLSQLDGTNGIDTIPTVSDMLKGDGGRLWFKTYDPATDSHWVSRKRTGGEWIVVESDGTPVARVGIPGDVRLMDIRGDRVAGVATDDLGVERVRVFALHRGPGPP